MADPRLPSLLYAAGFGAVGLFVWLSGRASAKRMAAWTEEDGWDPSAQADSRADSVLIGLALAGLGLLGATRLGLNPPERSHLLEYGLLAGLLWGALQDRHVRTGTPSRAAVAWGAFLGAASIGVLDELVQAHLSQRVGDPRDAAFNALAAGGVTGYLALFRHIPRRLASRFQSHP